MSVERSKFNKEEIILEKITYITVLAALITLSANSQNKTNRSFVYSSKPTENNAADSRFAKKEINSIKKNSKGRTIFMDTDIKSTRSQTKSNIKDTLAECYDYLDAIKDYIDIKKPSDEFVLLNIISEKNNKWHAKMQQTINGIPIYGSQVMLHIIDGSLKCFNGNNFPTPTNNNQSLLVDKKSCENIAISELKNITYFDLTSLQKQLLDYSEPTSNIVYYPDPANGNNLILCYHFTIRPNFIERWECFVDANNGRIVNKYLNSPTDGKVKTYAKDLKGERQLINLYKKDSLYYMIDASQKMFDSIKSQMITSPVGAIITVDAGNTYLAKIDQIKSKVDSLMPPVAVSAHNHTALTYNYFMNRFGYSSYDGKGSSMLSLINVSERDSSPMLNAMWNGKYMIYGNGDKNFYPFTIALDICAHEITHAVIEHTAALEYIDESGAINESYCDIFGAMVEGKNWKLSEDVLTDSSIFRSGNIRDMSDPHNGCDSISQEGWQPKDVSEKYFGKYDWGGVHINSGIPNYVYYLIADSISNAKAEQIYFRALTKYILKTAKFSDLRVAIIQATKDLYTTKEINTVIWAFDKVGIMEINKDTIQTVLTPNPGKETILYINTNPADTISIYTVDTTFVSPKMCSRQKINNRISITDNASMACFVSDNNKITNNIVRLANPLENVLNGQTIWKYAAISKDGSKYAATKKINDTSIYIFNIDNGKMKRFRLYDPFISFDGWDNTDSIAANILEWDYSGENILYDAHYKYINKYNGTVKNKTNLFTIKVWDNKSQSFDDGFTTRLLNDMPSNIKVANPSYAKNHTKFLAYDKYDSTTKKHSVWMNNIAEGKDYYLFSNNDYAYPSFNILDNKIYYQSYDTTLKTNVINSINLKSNFVQADTNSKKKLIDYARFPLCFATSNRNLSNKSIEKEVINYYFKQFTPAAIGIRRHDTITLKVPKNTDLTKLVASFTLSDKATGRVSNKVQASGSTVNDFSKPLKFTVTAEDGTSKDYTIIVELTNSINNLLSVGSYIKIYPNPANDYIYIDTKGIIKQIDIYSTMGKLQLSYSDVGSALNISALKSGLYFMELKTDNGIARSKFIKK